MSKRCFICRHKMDDNGCTNSTCPRYGGTVTSSTTTTDTSTTTTSETTSTSTGAQTPIFYAIYEHLNTIYFFTVFECK